MKRFALLLALLATSLAAAPNPVTTVILVRHAEKASQEDASPLTPAGTERANELARVLAGVKVDAIYTTQYRTYASDLAREIREQRRGQTVLVVGHSNTTVSVMKAFGADMPKIEESEFDNLYVLTDVDGASPKVVALRYGAVAR